jgi:uncharacterized protein (TIGR00251 family)
MAMLHVKAVPGASRSRIAGRYGDGIKVQVAAAPERGKANAAVIEVLAEALGVKESQVVLVSGQTQPRKVFRIDGLNEAGLAGRLKAALGEI